MDQKRKQPRRWRSESGSTFGCYFPETDLNIGQMGLRGTGAPKNVAWLDSVEDLPWIENPVYAEALPFPTDQACSCLHTAPCDGRCTCLNPGSSFGCRRCCTYGSAEQQRAAAERLSKAIDATYGSVVEQALKDAEGSFSTVTPVEEVVAESLASYRVNAKPAPSSACRDCGVDMHYPLCGICERKRMLAELEVLRRFKEYALYEGDEPKVRERFRQETGLELP